MEEPRIIRRWLGPRVAAGVIATTAGWLIVLPPDADCRDDEAVIAACVAITRLESGGQAPAAGVDIIGTLQQAV